MKIYTKKGDKGNTSLIGGTQVSKGHLRIESYGTVDELNSWIGIVRDSVNDETLRSELKDIQDRLFTTGATLATDPNKGNKKSPDLLDSDIEQLEKGIDRMDTELPALQNFILPGGHVNVSQAHVARCVCRRAERLVVRLSELEPVEGIVIRYLNRLSDYLFTLARKISHDLGAEEVTWQARKS